MPIPDFAGLRVLVTGGAGFIGSHLVDALVERGARVRVLDDLSSGSVDNLAHHGDAVELQRGDIRDVEACRRACDGVTWVFHLAALGSVPKSLEDPATTIAINVAGSANVFAAAREAGVRRTVYASSSSVYGDSTALPSREGHEGAPLSPYALSKAMTEQLAASFARNSGQELVGLRFFNVFGPRQSPEGPYAAVIPRFLAAAHSNRPMEIHGDGEQTRDFAYVGDAVEAALLAAGAPSQACSAAYNVAGGERVTMNELAARLAALVNSSAPPRHVALRPGDIRHSFADLTAAREKLGYAPRVPLGEGLDRLWLACTAAEPYA
ncbi:MAG TPA: NAD-dependent epimerase/dehydratase family protein [Thermoanaerobaculia bacterium]|jgi:nucleoside-diphosphate-sugar epimerase|nr:NAD-dependent epimerase/dehydratase family protein [Thermoanaerobaculia bacterium]